MFSTSVLLAAAVLGADTRQPISAPRPSVSVTIKVYGETGIGKKKRLLVGARVTVKGPAVEGFTPQKQTGFDGKVTFKNLKADHDVSIKAVHGGPVFPSISGHPLRQFKNEIEVTLRVDIDRRFPVDPYLTRKAKERNRDDADAPPPAPPVGP